MKAAATLTTIKAFSGHCCKITLMSNDGNSIQKIEQAKQTKISVSLSS